MKNLFVLEIKPGMKSQWAEKPDTRLFIESVSQASITPEQSQIDTTRMAVLGMITKIYQMLMPYLFIRQYSVSFYWCFMGSKKDRSIRSSGLQLPCQSLLSPRLLLVSLHVVTTFPEITTLYLSPAYPLLIWLIWMVIMAALVLIFQMINPKKSSNLAQDGG